MSYQLASPGSGGNVRTYSATASREGDWWVVEVAGVGVTQTKRLEQIPDMARDLVSLMEDLPADHVRISVDVKLGGELDALRRQHERLSREAEAAAEVAKGARETFMRKLQAAHLSARDIAELTGVSHQRVSQLVGAAKDVRRAGLAAAAAAAAAARNPPSSSTNRTTRSRSSAKGRFIAQSSVKRTVKATQPAAGSSQKAAKSDTR